MSTSSFTQNRLFATLTFTFAFIANIAFGQAEANFVSSFNGDCSIVKLDLNEHVEVKTWDSPNVRIVINVRFANANVRKDIIKGFAELGRYNLESNLTAQSLSITATQISHLLKLNGYAIKDNIHFTVFVPKHVLVIKSREELYSFAKS